MQQKAENEQTSREMKKEKERREQEEKEKKENMKRKEQDLREKEKRLEEKDKMIQQQAAHLAKKQEKKKEQEQEQQKQQQWEKEKQEREIEDEAKEAEKRMEERRRASQELNTVRTHRGETTSAGSQEKKEAKTKAPPENLTRKKRLEEPEKRKEVVISETDGSEREKEGIDSEESAEEEQMQPGIIDIEKYEYQIGPQMRMKNALAEQRDILERGRYVEKIRSAQTIKIICEPEVLDKMFQEQRKETTHRALEDLRSWEDMYYGTAIQYINQYLYSLTEAIPRKYNEVWELFEKHPQEYITSIKIRDASQNIGHGVKKHFLLGNEERTNFAVTDYLERKLLVENETQNAKGILPEWKEVRIGDDYYSKTLLKLQMITNLVQAAAEGKYSAVGNALKQEPRTTEEYFFEPNRQGD